MNVEKPESYSPIQKAMADAFRVHKINASLTPSLYPASAAFAIWGLTRMGVTNPAVWQELVSGIDRLTQSPLAEMAIEVGPGKFTVHNVLVLLSTMSFDLTPRLSIYDEFQLAVAQTLMGDASLTAENADGIETAMAVYRQLTVQLFNLVTEYMLVNYQSASLLQVVQPVTDGMAAIMLTYMGAQVPEAMRETLALDLRVAAMDWAAHYGPQVGETHGPLQGIILWNGVLLRTVLKDVEQAEEYMLSSSNVQYDEAYKALPQIDRDYIYFHRVVGSASKGE